MKNLLSQQGLSEPEPAISSIPLSATRTVAWIALNADFNVASFRYRCLAPAYSLRQLGWRVQIAAGNVSQCQVAEVLVFVKAFGPDHVALATRAKRAGSKIIVDICDNIFVADYSHAAATVTSAGFIEMAALADLIVTPSRSLAAVVTEYIGESSKVTVIPDCALSYDELLQIQDSFRGGDLSSKGAERGAHSAAEILINPQKYPALLKSARRFLRRSFLIAKGCCYSVARRCANHRQQSLGQSPQQQRKRVVWFGKHGTRHSSTGIISLSKIVPDLVAVNNLIPLQLVVISNNKAKFLRYMTGLPFPTYYRRWSNETTSEELNRADLVVLPNFANEFAATKSANRALLALSHGVPVVASHLDSLSELTEAIAIENWTQNISTYLMDEARAQRDVEFGKRIIADKFSPASIGDMWASCLLSVISKSDADVFAIS